MNIKFMSYNIQHGFDYINKDKIDLSLTVNAIRKCGADIIGLNEVRNSGSHHDYQNQAGIIAEQLGYYYYFAEAVYFENQGPYGNAILSKFPIKYAQTIPIEDPPIKNEDTYYETRCILKAEFNIAGAFTVFVSHFGLAESEKKNAVKELVSQLKNESNPCIFMGDLNMPPEHKTLAPIYNYLCDTAVKFSSPLFSFPSDKPDRKIDYIFASKDIKIVSADIPALIASDHRPHVAVLDI